MTKELYPIAGRIKVDCRVTSIKNRRKFVSTETGTNSMFNVAREYKSKIQNAKLNAIYKHMSKGGGSDAVVEVLDFDIKYFTDKVKIVKEKRAYTNRKNATYVYGIDKNTGKHVNKARILRKGDIEEFK